jgi:Domain of unknown function (DU1801)
MERSTTTPDEFIAGLPDRVRDDIATLDAVIAEEMQGTERVLWEGPMWGGTEQRILGYGSQQYTNRSGTHVDWFVIGLAAQKHYLSLYVNAADGDGYVLGRFAGRLGKVRVGSANATFKRATDIDLAVLREMAAQARAGIPPG